MMEVLRKAYSRVLSLKDYLQAILPEGSVNQLLLHPKKGFPVFLSKTVVAMVSWDPPDKETLPPIATSEHDDQMQLVEEVIQELLLDGRTTDVLTHGLHRKNGMTTSLSFHPDHNYPQLITPYWSNLLQIIGRSNMKELLLNASLFTAVPSASYIQLSGVPVHAVIATKSGTAPKPTYLSNTSRGRSNDCRRSVAGLDGAVNAVSFCYDKTWCKKLRKTHPLNILPASNKGALELVKLIFPRHNIRDGSRTSKRNVNRVPGRLVRSKNMLRQLLTNFKKTPLRNHHSRLSQNRAIQKLFQVDQETQETSTVSRALLENQDESSYSRAGTSKPCPDGDRVVEYNSSRDVEVPVGRIERDTRIGTGKDNVESSHRSTTSSKWCPLIGPCSPNDVHMEQSTYTEQANTQHMIIPIPEAMEQSTYTEQANAQHMIVPPSEANSGIVASCRNVVHLDQSTHTEQANAQHMIVPPPEANSGIDASCRNVSHKEHHMSSEDSIDTLGGGRDECKRLDNSVCSSRDRSFELFSSPESEKHVTGVNQPTEYGKRHSPLTSFQIVSNTLPEATEGTKRNTDNLKIVSAGAPGCNIPSSEPALRELWIASNFTRLRKTQQSSNHQRGEMVLSTPDSCLDHSVNVCLPGTDDLGQESLITVGECDCTLAKTPKQRRASDTKKMTKRNLDFRKRVLQRVRKNRVIGAFHLKQGQLKHLDRWKRDHVRRKRSQTQLSSGIGGKRKHPSPNECENVPPEKKARLDIASQKPSDEGDPNTITMDKDMPSPPCDRSRPLLYTKPLPGGELISSLRNSHNRKHLSSSYFGNIHRKTTARLSHTVGKTTSKCTTKSDTSTKCAITKVGKCNWKRKNSSSESFSAESPLSMGLTGTEVYVPLSGLLKKIIPDEVWGSTANKSAFFKYIKELLKLGRFEKLPLSLMSQSLKATDCQWASVTNEDFGRLPRTDRVKKQELVAAMFIWMVTDLVVPLVRTLYYATETSVSKNGLIYYPKHIWRRLQEKAISDYENQGVVKHVEKDYVNHLIVTQKTLGMSRLRFIPKENGFRPIARMGKSTLRNKKQFGINFLLNDLLDVLNYLRKSHSELYGSSLLGITSIYPKWKEFVSKRKQSSDTRPLYFVKVDISKCYDSIPHSKLPVVMASVLKEKTLPQSYLLQRYTVTSLNGQGVVNKRSMRWVSPGNNARDSRKALHQVLIDLASEGTPVNSVLCNQASSHRETVDSLLDRLHHLVKYDIVSIDHKEYLRTKGISQGSVLSSSLCSIFYSNLENGYLVGVSQDGLLMRLIDDFLLVTPHLNNVTRFVDVLLSDECAKQFGCEINPLKTLTNFELEYNGRKLDRVEDGDWCGFLFNMRTLDVRNDYQRYESTSFRYSMTLCFTSVDILETMKKKLMQALHRSKGLLIFIDPSINSLRVIVKNVYHLMLLTAFRFHSYIQALPLRMKKLYSVQQLLDIILEIGSSFYFKARASLKRLPESLIFTLDLHSVKWLCAKAFDVKLSRHLGAHKELVSLLRQKRRMLSRKLDRSIRFLLAGASTPDIPAPFFKTRF